MTHVQGHKIKYSDRNNTAVDGSISLKFGTEFHQVTDDTLQMFTVKTAMDKLSDSKLGIGVIPVVKTDKDWRGVGRTQVVMHLQLPRF